VCWSTTSPRTVTLRCDRPPWLSLLRDGGTAQSLTLYPPPPRPSSGLLPDLDRQRDLLRRRRPVLPQLRGTC
jgi:hypothetical protein